MVSLFKACEVSKDAIDGDNEGDRSPEGVGTLIFILFLGEGGVERTSTKGVLFILGQSADPTFFFWLYVLTDFITAYRRIKKQAKRHVSPLTFFPS